MAGAFRKISRCSQSKSIVFAKLSEIVILKVRTPRERFLAVFL
jgi:hypothetical protein